MGRADEFAYGNRIQYLFSVFLRTYTLGEAENRQSAKNEKIGRTQKGKWHKTRIRM